MLHYSRKLSSPSQSPMRTRHPRQQQRLRQPRGPSSLTCSKRHVLQHHTVDWGSSTPSQSNHHPGFCLASQAQSRRLIVQYCMPMLNAGSPILQGEAPFSSDLGTRGKRRGGGREGRGGRGFSLLGGPCGFKVERGKRLRVLGIVLVRVSSATRKEWRGNGGIRLSRCSVWRRTLVGSFSAAVLLRVGARMKAGKEGSIFE